jgi:DNA replication and repair protein RecF
VSFLKSIQLSNYRNYSSKSHSDITKFEFQNKKVFIIGPNAVGKSNLIEAIGYVGFGLQREPDKVLLNLNTTAPCFKLDASYELENRDFILSTTGGSKEHKSLKINGVAYKTWSAATDDLLKIVSFKAKESLDLVRGAPQKRRDWLDTALSLLNKRYAAALKSYNRLLDQRNSLLKQLYEGKSKRQIIQELEPWDIELAREGSLIIEARKKFLSDNQDLFAENYLRIGGEDCEKASLVYLSSLSEDEAVNIDSDFFYAKLVAGHDADLMRGQTLVGPHREEFAFLVQNQEARYFASQGQQRTCSLALKLMQLEVWQSALGYSPILLLDDVTAELDLNRQEALFKSIGDQTQVFVTTTHLVNLPTSLNKDYQIITMSKT